SHPTAVSVGTRHRRP
ncbi:MAG: hypothetical protein MOP51_1475, partial [Citricoccus sp.]|nr:hypothetical protein [Citricoccus sp. WCRC_4]